MLGSWGIFQIRGLASNLDYFNLEHMVNSSRNRGLRPFRRFTHGVKLLGLVSKLLDLEYLPQGWLCLAKLQYYIFFFS